MDMETLHQIPIHPAIAEKKNLFLADLVPLEKLQSWAMNCREAHGMHSLFASLRSPLTMKESMVENVMEVTEDIKFIKIGTQKEENEHLKAEYVVS